MNRLSRLLRERRDRRFAPGRSVDRARSETVLIRQPHVVVLDLVEIGSGGHPDLNVVLARLRVERTGPAQPHAVDEIGAVHMLQRVLRMPRRVAVVEERDDPPDAVHAHLIELLEERRHPLVGVRGANRVGRFGGRVVADAPRLLLDVEDHGVDQAALHQPANPALDGWLGRLGERHENAASHELAQDNGDLVAIDIAAHHIKARLHHRDPTAALVGGKLKATLRVRAHQRRAGRDRRMRHRLQPSLAPGVDRAAQRRRRRLRARRVPCRSDHRDQQRQRPQRRKSRPRSQQVAPSRPSQPMRKSP